MVIGYISTLLSGLNVFGLTDENIFTSMVGAGIMMLTKAP